MALVQNEAVAFASASDLFSTNGSSLKNALIGAGWTVATPSATEITAKNTTGEGYSATLHSIAAPDLFIVGDIRLVHAGWIVRQGPVNSIVKAVDPVLGKITVMSAAGFVAGAVTIQPNWQVNLSFDLDATAGLIHFRAWRSPNFLGFAGNLVKDTAVEIPTSAPFDGWIYCDLNGVLVVLRHAVGDYRIAHAGAVASTRSYPRSARTTLSADAVSGATILQLASGHASMDGWTAPMLIYLHDKDTGEVELHQVDTVDTVHDQLDLHEALGHTFPAGSFIGRDPHPMVLGGSIHGVMGPAFTFENPEVVVLNPAALAIVRPASFTAEERIALAVDADGVSHLSPIRYSRFGTDVSETVGMNLRAYECAGDDLSVPDETLLVAGRETVRVFTERATGRRIAARKTAFPYFVVDF